MSHPPEEAWHKTACILCENNCGLQVQLDGRRFAKSRGDQGRVATAGYTCNKALRLDHYQNGGARLTHRCAARPTEFHRDRLGYRHHEVAMRLTDVKNLRRRQDLLLRRRGTGQPSGRRVRRRPAPRDRCPLPIQRAGPGEDRRRLGRRAPHRRPHHRRLRARGSIGVPRQEPLAVARRPARPHGAAADPKDPARSMIVLDPVRTEPAELADIHLQVRPGTDAWCLSAIFGVLVRDDWSITSSSPRHHRSAGAAGTVRASTSPPTPKSAGGRDTRAHRRAPYRHREQRAPPTRTSACSRAPTARSSRI